MQEGKYNLRNPAVKRILQEIKELQKDPSNDFMAAALEDNIFEWHFAVRGPPDTEFQGGIFHGRILLPPEYPFKPPSFLMLSPTGRFETHTKICLSISSHHPEHWQPSWSVRTALTALIAFFPTPGNGAIGSLDYTKEERAAMAAKAREQPPQFGNTDRQAVTNEIHAAMLAGEAQMKVPSQQAKCYEAALREEAMQAQRVDQHAEPEAQSASGLPASSCPDMQADEKSTTAQAAAASAEAAPSAAPEQAALPPPAAACAQPAATLDGANSAASQPPQPQPPRLRPVNAVEVANNILPELQQQQQQDNSLLGQAVGAIAGDPPAGAPQSWEDRGLTVVAVALVVLIAAILFRRILVIAGADVTSLM